MRFADVVATSRQVAAVSGRIAKRDVLAALLARTSPAEAPAVVGFLVGAPRQGRVGVGWAAVAAVDPPPAATAVLDVLDVDRAIDDLASAHGPGSRAARTAVLTRTLERATADEAEYLRRLLTGGVRHGALEGALVDAVAAATRLPLATVRRATMLGGDLGMVAAAALEGGRPAVEAIGLTVGRAVQPMLAATADDVAAAVAEVGGLASVEWKLDGARIQAHRDGDEVRLYTRNLNDVTERLPGVAEVVRSLPARQLVLDGEVLGQGLDGSPDAFQDTMSRFSRADRPPEGAGPGLQAFFFDAIHVDGEDLIDRTLLERLDVLEAVAGPLRVPSVLTDDPDRARAFADDAVARGHEGVMVKVAGSSYEAGRRGRAWRKVKPVHLFDLVVLAAEWGSGRRRGWLSNLHLGARADGDEHFVMVGKTFKGLTDELLTWQTEQLLARRTADEAGAGAHVVHVRPELVVEVAIDGVQISRRYPGGVALRFARVRRYRTDKAPGQADLLSALQAMAGGA